MAIKSGSPTSSSLCDLQRSISEYAIIFRMSDTPPQAQVYDLQLSAAVAGLALGLCCALLDGHGLV